MPTVRRCGYVSVVFVMVPVQRVSVFVCTVATIADGIDQSTQVRYHFPWLANVTSLLVLLSEHTAVKVNGGRRVSRYERFYTAQ